MEQKAGAALKHKKNRRRFWRAAVLCTVVFVLFLAGWYYVPVLGSRESQYCARCHAMAPEYLTWQASDHAQFQCQVCHRTSGVGNFMKYQAMLFKEILFFPAKGDGIKSNLNLQIPDAVCLKCHSQNRAVSPSSDTVVPHGEHTGQGVACVTCHAGVAHGRIVERGVTAKIPAENWDESVAEEQMAFENTTPRMGVCLDCHGQRGVTEKCSVCHSRQIVPASHKNGDFDLRHGPMAQQDFKPCNLCHSYTLQKKVNLVAINVEQYTRTNTFCNNCHLNKPPSHKTSEFGAAHGQMAKTRGIDSCLVCHELIGSKNSQKGSDPQTICNKCHWFK